MAIGPDGTAYVGTVNRLLAVRDGTPEARLTTWNEIQQKHTPLVGLALMLLSAAFVWGLEKLWARLMDL